MPRKLFHNLFPLEISLALRLFLKDVKIDGEAENTFLFLSKRTVNSHHLTYCRETEAKTKSLSLQSKNPLKLTIVANFSFLLQSPFGSRNIFRNLSSLMSKRESVFFLQKKKNILFTIFSCFPRAVFSDSFETKKTRVHFPTCWFASRHTRLEGLLRRNFCI